MMSLRWKLWGIVIGTVLLTLLLIIWVANWLTQGEISDYVTHEQRAIAAAIAPLLADFYMEHEGWAELAEPIGIGKLRPIAPQERPPIAQATREPMPLRLRIKAVLDRNRVVVTDAAGRVVADSMSEDLGQLLTESEVAQGQPIETGGREVGRVYVGLKASVESVRLEALFGERIQVILLGAGALAGLAVLLLGGWFAAHLVKPIKTLQQAACNIAEGQFTTRLRVKRRDELGQLADAMNAMAQHLEGGQKVRRQMVADIAHELRTPLAVLQGNLEAMSDGMLPLTRERAASIHAESVLLGRLVEDLRTLSLAEAGELTLKPEEIALQPWAQSMAESLKPAFDAQHARLSLEIHDSLRLTADPQRLRQVLLNLLTNALQHSERGSSVVLSARRDNQWMLIEVRDTGQGIPPAELTLLFDRFHRGVRSKVRPGSTGLGLAIAKALVEAHRGRIEVDSALGRGTCFSIVMPIAVDGKPNG